MSNMEQIWGFLGIVVFLAGLYAFRSFLLLKRDGKVDAGILLGKDLNWKKCKDPGAYTEKLAPALLIFSIAAIAYGVIDVIHCFVWQMPAVDMIAMLVFVCVLILFGVYTGRLKQRFF